MASHIYRPEYFEKIKKKILINIETILSYQVDAKKIMFREKRVW